MIQNLNKETEQNIDKTLLSLSCIIDKDYGLINTIKRVRQYYDEPKFWYYSVDLDDSFTKNDGKHFHSKASGASLFSQKEALLKCLGESVERYCNFIFLNKSTFAIKAINKMAYNFIDPRSISAFSKKQINKAKFSRFKINHTSVFRWTKCVSLPTEKVFLVPSQFIYLSYPYLKNEPSIYSSISTGVAGGANLSAAITRGICEIMERDAFMIFYLNKFKPSRIDLEKINNTKIQKLLLIAQRYKLEVVTLDITTDLGVPAIASIVINRSGLGKALSVGLKCDFDIIKAITGSVEEAFHTRSWLRSSYENKPSKVSPQNLYKKSDIRTRGLLWYQPEIINKLDFWLKDLKAMNPAIVNKNLNSGEKLKKLIEILKKKNYDIYYKDITLKEFKKLNYFVVKVIIPKMQPLYLDENYPLLGGERLYNIPGELNYKNKTEENLNKFPHPFL